MQRRKLIGVKHYMTKLFCLVSICLWACSSFAQIVVVPTERVVSGVVIRSSATTSSDQIGKLIPGESATFLGEVPRWYRIEHPTAGVGFVSKSWTRVVTHDLAPAASGFDVYVVDVATGLAVFVRGPDFTLVYDAGSGDDKAGNRFLSFIDEVHPGTDVIDHLIVSHPHEDHIEMLPELLEQKQIRSIWDSGVLYASCIYQKFLEKVALENAEYHTAIHEPGQEQVDFLAECSSTGHNVDLKFSNRIETGSVQLGQSASMNFLHVDGTPKSDVNENSLVVLLQLGTVRILLPGDSGGGDRDDPNTPPKDGSVEKALIDCCSDQLSADIIVLGHHGSKTSSRKQYLEAVGAKDFIVSSGPKSFSGTVLSDQEVLNLIENDLGGTIWRTDNEDDACKVNPDKIGNDNDDKAGGCDTIHIKIQPGQIGYSIKVFE